MKKTATEDKELLWKIIPSNVFFRRQNLVVVFYRRETLVLVLSGKMSWQGSLIDRMTFQLCLLYREGFQRSSSLMEKVVFKMDEVVFYMENVIFSIEKIFWVKKDHLLHREGRLQYFKSVFITETIFSYMWNEIFMHGEVLFLWKSRLL